MNKLNSSVQNTETKFTVGRIDFRCFGPCCMPELYEPSSYKLNNGCSLEFPLEQSQNYNQSLDIQNLLKNYESLKVLMHIKAYLSVYPVSAYKLSSAVLYTVAKSDAIRIVNDLLDLKLKECFDVSEFQQKYYSLSHPSK